MSMGSYRAESTDAWAIRHNAALVSPKGFEIAVVGLLRGLHAYRGTHQHRYESDVLDDGATLHITNGLRTVDMRFCRLTTVAPQDLGRVL